MTDHDRFQLAIVGSGPAGLSAAARAAEYDAQTRQNDPDHRPTHILLESFEAHAKTIHRYQKGKHVMAEPNYLDLRSPLRFRAGTREAILDSWETGLREKGVNARFNAEVASISGERGAFEIRLNDGETIRAERVVLAIGTAGNPRRLNVPGEGPGLVQYQLDDPDAYHDEAIVVVGAGDAAIENALGLSKNNKVYIVNRKSEFSRPKEGNRNAVLAAINDPGLEFDCFYEANPEAIEPPAAEGAMGAIVLRAPDGQHRVPCHRVIARLGSIPPRKFVEGCGIEFPNDKPDALPEISSHYESNVPGLYVIGSLAGYPLIKQAMNQGFEVVEYIRGHDIEPADNVLLRLRFAGLPYVAGAEEILDLYQRRIPMFSHMNALSFRELVIESRIIASVPDEAARRDAQARADTVAEERGRDLLERQQRELEQLRATGEPITDADLTPPPEPAATSVVTEGTTLYRNGEYTNTFYTIADGEVYIQYEQDGPTYTLTAGQFFGEVSLLSGRPRSGTAVIGPETIVIETPRRTMLKVMGSNEEVRQGVDWMFIVRALRNHFAPGMPLDELRRIARKVELEQFEVGQALYREGEQGASLHLIRSGTVALYRGEGDHEVVVGHAQSGSMIGETALMGDPVRRETARAAVRTETIKLRAPQFLALVREDPQRIERLQKATEQQLKLGSQMASMPESASIVSFLMDEGLGEATNAMVIDEDLCVGCDNCEKACADTHGGVSRLDRKSGAGFASVQVPISCRHCEHPHCMKDCPVDAIHRAPSGEVFIDDSCIGCGNCVTNCPYDAIHMAPDLEVHSGWLSWLLFGAGRGPGDGLTAQEQQAADESHGKKAVKCDGCKDLSGGPACVRACPTGAAIRIAPDDFPDLIRGR